MERAVGKNEKLESFKLESLKLESLAEVGKSQTKLERTERSWKEPIEVEKFEMKLESLGFAWLFSTSAKLSNFKRNFPTSLGSFQLR